MYTAYNNSLRILLNIARYENGQNYSASQMFVYNGTDNCSVVIRKLIYSFMRRLQQSDNYYIRSFCDGISTDIFYKSLAWKYWRRSLFILYDK